MPSTPDRVGFPPWDEKDPPGLNPIRGPVFTNERDSIAEVYDGLWEKWEDAPGLNDKRMGQGYICFREPDTGAVLRWQVPEEAMNDAEVFGEWLESEGLDWDEEGFFGYVDNSPDIPQYEEGK